MFPTIQEDRMPLPGQRMKHGGDESLRVRFFTAPKFLPEQSRIEERDCYDEDTILEYIEIRIPGGDIVVRVARPEDKKRFSELYRQWKLNEGEDVGTPLDVLGFTETQKDLCTRANIFSIEQLASIGDHVLSSIGIGAINMRKRAKDFISNKPVANEELDALKEQNNQLMRTVTELMEAVKALSGDKEEKGK
jgi:hypothetical protein